MAGECPPPVARKPCGSDLRRRPWRPRSWRLALAAGGHRGDGGELLRRGGAANAIARTVGARVSVLDVGVAGEFEGHPLLRAAKVRRGTDDLSRSPAMSREEAARAVMAGAGVAGELIESGGVDLLVTGDMGIGNTTPAAGLISAFTGRPPEETTGRGTGIDDETFELKIRVVEEALNLHDPDPTDPLGVLARSVVSSTRR